MRRMASLFTAPVTVADSSTESAQPAVPTGSPPFGRLDRVPSPQGTADRSPSEGRLVSCPDPDAALSEPGALTTGKSNA